ncbi:MAG: hypothetical protein ABR573_04115 [Candidatus Dormibacteria bacterium]
MAIDIEFAVRPATFSNASLLALVLGDRLARRGWQFREAGASVTAHRPEWPAQLCVLVREAEEDAPAMMGLAMDLSAMPLRGERFRDVFNSDREQLMRGYGRCNVLQLTHQGSWLRPQSDRAFLHGMTDGISRRTSLAVFDRASVDEPGSLAERMAADSNRIVETGAELAGTLQRLYQRTVLSQPVVDDSRLPDIVRPSIAVLAPTADTVGGDYPWRR